MKEETRTKIYDIAQQIANLAKKDGDEILIGISTLENGILNEGAVSSPELSYDNACKMVMGIAGFITEWYGGEHCNCGCLSCETCEHG